jgi:hypothetical protein
LSKCLIGKKIRCQVIVIILKIVFYFIETKLKHIIHVETHT